MTISDKILRAKDDYDAVYEAGYEKGKSDGGDGGSYDQGYADGKQDVYDAFWENYQDNGKRDIYNYAFSYWTDDAFRPKYDIVPIAMTGGFQYSKITDLKGLLERQGVKLDLSNAGTLNQLFLYSSCTTCPVVDVSKVYTSAFTFFTHAHDMKTIEKVILPTGRALTFQNPFHTCTALEDIVFEGDIMANGLSFQWSPKLSRDSIVSVVNALSPTTTGLTVTLSKTAVESAFDGTPVPVDEYVELSPSCHGNEYSFETSYSGNVASVTVNGGRGFEDDGGSNGSIDFINNVLPAGEYEISFSTTGYSESAWSLACGNNTTGTLEPLSPGGTMRVTINDGDALYAGLDLAGNHDNFTASVSIKRISYVYDWESLAATKPNWTIALV